MVKATIKILNWVSGSVLYESDKATTIKEALVEANLYGADLRGANLHGANLYRADLHGANLHGADLHGSDLREANLHRANLYGADLREANLYGADLRGANLHRANLYGANLYGADLAKLPTTYINSCSRDMLFIFQCLKSELPGLRKALVEGRVDGTQYEGDCACLIGTLGNLDGGVKKVCEAIPYYDKGTHNPGEAWFLNIHKGDTAKNNQFSAHAVKLIDSILKPKKDKK